MMEEEAMTCPPPSTARSEFVRPVKPKVVVVALVVVAFVANVEEAMRENGVVAFNQRAVLVETTGDPAYVVGVQANAPVPERVIGVAPMAAKVAQVTEPEQVTEVVATL